MTRTDIAGIDAPARPRLRLRRHALGAGAALLVVGATACGTGDAEEATAIQTVQAERGNLRITAEATGTIEPIRKVEVKSKASGEILTLQGEVGDQVEPGALLATVDPRDVRNRLDQTQADLVVAEARAEIAEAQLRRSEQLFESGVITEQELENAKLEAANAHANLVKARTNHELAELQLTDVTIRAPMKGFILEKNVEQGQVIQSASQNVSGGTTLYVMASLDDVQVRTLVDETDMGEIKPGMPTQVTVEAYPDRVFRGDVLKVEPQAVVEQNVTMFPVIVRLDNRAGFLKPGMNAEVEILIDQARDVLLVPNNAVVLPQDAVPAAMALGLDPESLDTSQLGGGRFAAGAGRPGGSGGAGGRGGDAVRGGQGAEGAEGAEGSEGTQGARGAQARRDGQGARGARGDASRGQGDNGSEADAEGAAGSPRTSIVEQPGFAQGSRLTRRAVVFVMSDAGAPEPRVVEIGLNDWDRTQIVSGLEEGARIAVIGAAQLQAQQQEFLDRIRSRSGGGPFGR